MCAHGRCYARKPFLVLADVQEIMLVGFYVASIRMRDISGCYDEIIFLHLHTCGMLSQLLCFEFVRMPDLMLADVFLQPHARAERCASRSACTPAHMWNLILKKSCAVMRYVALAGCRH